MPTVLPVPPRGRRRPGVRTGRPDAPFTVHTRWIETEFVNTIPPYAGAAADAEDAGRARPSSSRSAASASRSPCPPGSAPSARRPAAGRGGAHARAAQEGRRRRLRRRADLARCRAPSSRSPSRTASVVEGDLVVVLEAMKMEQPLNAHKAGTVTGLTAEVGATVTSGAVICEIKD